MRKNVRKVLEAFSLCLPAIGDSKRTIWTDGRVVYSYKMPIAIKLHSGILIVDESLSPSRTTTSQIRALRYTFPEADVVGKLEELL